MHGYNSEQKTEIQRAMPDETCYVHLTYVQFLEGFSPSSVNHPVGFFGKVLSLPFADHARLMGFQFESIQGGRPLVIREPECYELPRAADLKYFIDGELPDHKKLQRKHVLTEREIGMIAVDCIIGQSEIERLARQQHGEPFVNDIRELFRELADYVEAN